MLRFLTHRILAAIPVLFLLSVVTFAIIHARPGDYGDYVYSMLTARGVSTTEAQRENNGSESTWRYVGALAIFGALAASAVVFWRRF